MTFLMMLKDQLCRLTLASTSLLMANYKTTQSRKIKCLLLWGAWYFAYFF